MIAGAGHLSCSGGSSSLLEFSARAKARFCPLHRHIRTPVQRRLAVLSAFVNAFRTPDLRKKLLFVLFVIVLFRLGSTTPAPGINVGNVQDAVTAASSGDNSGPVLVDQRLLRRCAAAADGVRARHHALHHREHHPAAARRGDPSSGGPQEGGPVRTDQDHAVHPLPHARPRDPAGNRHRGAGPQRQPLRWS